MIDLAVIRVRRDFPDVVIDDLQPASRIGKSTNHVIR